MNADDVIRITLKAVYDWNTNTNEREELFIKMMGAGFPAQPLTDDVLAGVAKFGVGDHWKIESW